MSFESSNNYPVYRTLVAGSLAVGALLSTAACDPMSKSVSETCSYTDTRTLPVQSGDTVEGFAKAELNMDDMSQGERANLLETIKQLNGNSYDLAAGGIITLPVNPNC